MERVNTNTLVRGKREMERNVTYNVRPRVGFGKRSTRLRSRDLELGHDDDDANVLREAVLDVTTDVLWWLRRLLHAGQGWSSVGRVGGEDFGEGDGGGGEFGGVEDAEEGAGEASDEGGSNVVGVALDHEGVVLHAVLAELEVTESIAEEHTSNDGRGGGSEPTSKGNLVGDIDGNDRRGEGELVGEKDVEGDAGDEIFVGIQGRLAGSLASVAEHNLAVGRRARGLGDVEDEMARESKSENVKSGPNVGGRGGDADDPL